MYVCPYVCARVHTQVYYRLMRASNHLRQGDTTLELARTMTTCAGHKPDRYIYNQMLKALALGGRGAQARALLAEMAAAGVALDAWSYTTCVSASANARDMEAAEQLVEDMRAAGIAPTAATYCSLIRGYGRLRQLDKARDAVRAMRLELAHVPEDAFVLATIVDMLVSCGRVAEARLCVRRAEQDAPHTLSPHAYGSLAKGLSREGLHEESLALLSHVKARVGVLPAATYNAVMSGMLGSGNLSAAIAVSKQMETEGIGPSKVTYTLLIKGFAQHKQLGMALEVYEGMRAAGVAVDTTVLNVMIDACARAGGAEGRRVLE